MHVIHCPHCDHKLNLRTAKSGVFRLSCKKCQQPFSLTITSNAKNEFQFQLSASKPETTRVDVEPKPAPAKIAPSPRTREEFQTRADISPESPTKSPAQDANQTRVSHGSEKDASNEAEQSFQVAEQPVLAGGADAPTRLGGYRIEGELGRGGLGVVYLARQVSLNRQVALKVIRASIAKNGRAISRFYREAYAAAQLVHHNVVQIYDLGNDSDTNFFSMEYVQGCNLSQLVKKEGKLEPEKAANYILQASRGLQFAHRQGMVHRDVKPANLLLNTEGVIKVADLGLVKVPDGDTYSSDEDDAASAAGGELTFAGTTVGTASYISPEQATNSSTVDHRADIYSLGCTFYVLLTGQAPFTGESAQEIISKHQTKPVQRPDLVVDRVDSKLADVVVKMVAKRPDDRYDDFGGVIEDLENYLGINSAEVFFAERANCRTV